MRTANADTDADTTAADANGVPALAVFDLDACFWNQEMYQLNHLVDRSNPVLGQLGRHLTVYSVPIPDCAGT